MKISALVKEYGAKNLRFFIPMRPSTSLVGLGMPIGMSCSDGPEISVECEIVEDRYKVRDGYKIQFKPINIGDGKPYYFATKTFYQMDFDAICKRSDGYEIYVLVDEDNNYEKIRN